MFNYCNSRGASNIREADRCAVGGDAVVLTVGEGKDKRARFEDEEESGYSKLCVLDSECEGGCDLNAPRQYFPRRLGLWIDCFFLSAPVKN
jgi:hypothetical protein